jgi:hypothetical protein
VDENAEFVSSYQNTYAELLEGLDLGGARSSTGTGSDASQVDESQTDSNTYKKGSLSKMKDRSFRRSFTSTDLAGSVSFLVTILVVSTMHVLM